MTRHRRPSGQPRETDAVGRAASPRGESGRRRLSRLLPLAVLLAGLVFVFASGWDRYLSLQALQAHRDWLVGQVADHPARSALAFVGAYAAVAAFSIPGGAALTLQGGFLFGTWLATAYAVLGATLGATALFLAARTVLGDLLAAKAGDAIQRMRGGFQENALSYLLFLRLIPVFPFWLVNLVPALLGVPLGTYLLATVLGIVPGTFVYASVGNGLEALVAAGAGAILAPEVIAPIGGLAVLSLLPAIYKTWRAGRR